MNNQPCRHPVKARRPAHTLWKDDEDNTSLFLCKKCNAIVDVTTLEVVDKNQGDKSR